MRRGSNPSQTSKDKNRDAIVSEIKSQVLVFQEKMLAGEKFVYKLELDFERLKISENCFPGAKKRIYTHKYMDNTILQIFVILL